MPNRDHYVTGHAAGASIRKDGDQWTLVLVRNLSHPPAKVWEAITDPDHIRQWAPFDTDRNLGHVGTATLTTIGAPKAQISESRITRADAPRVLEYTWGGQDVRWELEPLAKDGTRLTLLHNINRAFIAMGAAGWHICFDVMEQLLDGHPIGRIVANDALQFEGWQRLHAEYAREFGVETPSWPASPKS